MLRNNHSADRQDSDWSNQAAWRLDHEQEHVFREFPCPADQHTSVHRYWSEPGELGNTRCHHTAADSIQVEWRDVVRLLPPSDIPSARHRLHNNSLILDTSSRIL